MFVVCNFVSLVSLVKLVSSKRKEAGKEAAAKKEEAEAEAAEKSLSQSHSIL